MIVGVLNAVFMLICGMQYVGLVSVVVAITNLIPNFGPIIGAVIGGFVLLLVNPLHALMFIVFTVAVQFVDAYILKPKLFSGSLGVSGLLILVASIVLGNMFGVWGMVLSVPIAAILSFIFRDYILARHEKKRRAAAAKG
jgi:predicted PurR-regulated permease PerM